MLNRNLSNFMEQAYCPITYEKQVTWHTCGPGGQRDAFGSRELFRRAGQRLVVLLPSLVRHEEADRTRLCQPQRRHTALTIHWIIILKQNRIFSQEDFVHFAGEVRYVQCCENTKTGELSFEWVTVWWRNVTSTW